MNDPVPVSRFHRFGDLSRDVAGLVDWYRTFEQSIRQRRTVHEFHDQRGDAAGPLQSMDRSDVWMIQRRQRLRLAVESRERSASVATASGSTLTATWRDRLVSLAPQPKFVGPCSARGH